MKKHVRCPWCLRLKTKRNGLRIIRKRKIQRFRCLSCGHTFSCRLNHGVLTWHEKVKITHSHLAGRTSIRQLVRDTGFAKQTIQNAVYEVTKDCVSSAWITSKLNPKWGGYLAVDGSMIRVWDWSAKGYHYSKDQKRFLHKLVWIVALDLETLDIVHHHLADEETMIDLILFYRQIKENGYSLKGLVSDGNPDIYRSAKMVFKRDFPHQVCIRHYLERLRDKFRSGLILPKRYDEFRWAIHNGKYIPGLPNKLFTYQKVPGLPRTNQQIENLFRQGINQFHSHQSAYNYLNAWTLFRRFTAFTDCRDKSKNKKAPLELAGCDIKNLNYLSLQKSNLFIGR